MRERDYITHFVAHECGYLNFTSFSIRLRSRSSSRRRRRRRRTKEKKKKEIPMICARARECNLNNSEENDPDPQLYGLTCSAPQITITMANAVAFTGVKQVATSTNVRITYTTIYIHKRRVARIHYCRRRFSSFGSSLSLFLRLHLRRQCGGDAIRPLLFFLSLCVYKEYTAAATKTTGGRSRARALSPFNSD